VVHFPELAEHGDVSDYFEAGNTPDDLKARADSVVLWSPAARRAEAPAATIAHDDPIPLIPELAPATEYPVGALGAVLGEAAVSIARKVQCPTEIAAQSVLAVAALAAQAHADVMLPFGQTRPLSLFCFTVAQSSDRKSSADLEALAPIREYEQELGAQYAYELEHARTVQAAWQAERKKIEGNRKLEYAARIEALKQLGREPDMPLHPLLTVPEPTIEGLTRMWALAPASLGVFSAEGGQLVGGHSMSEDNRLKSAAFYSELWDGKPVRRVRAGDGVTLLNGRRLALHVMIQPEAAQAFLSDSLLRSQGLLSRILVAAPATLAGQRLYREADARNDIAIAAYGRKITQLLSRTWPLAEGRRNELAPRVLRMSAGAQEVWRALHDDIERRSGPAGELAPVREFAGKTAEHSARIAGVLSIAADCDAPEISGVTMDDAAALARWYLGEAQRLAAASMTDPKVARAQRLLEWMQARSVPEDGVSVRWITQFAPADLRTKAAAEGAVAVLVAHGWLRPRPGGKRWELVGGVRP
jgi:Protein of unknown function (DUF3987)